MEIGNFEVVSKNDVVKRIYRKEAFSRNAWEGVEWHLMWSSVAEFK